MEMPYMTKQRLEEAETLVQQIYMKHKKQAEEECKPYMEFIIDIKNMYPSPLNMSAEMAAIFSSLDDKKGK